ncbi:MAG: UTP--glucose-1-phosphate uridylyltransferase [Alphaproteobacteria bacterium]|nr:UTP--glucose-1-phosphate uridylyltransferase [Alphaproteobacteria bacterium]
MSKWKPVRKAVFPVAGLGTRFLPATKVMPKEMLPLVDRPLIQHAFEEAREAGIEEFIFVTGRHKNMLEEHFDFQPELEDTLKSRGKFDMLEAIKSSEISENQLFLTRQTRPLGLGHAIWCAHKLVGDEPFAILLPDDVVLADTPCLKQMVDSYNETGGNLVSVMDVPREQTASYGILDTGKENGNLIEVKGLVEKPKPEDAPSTLSVIGRYILQPEVFTHLSKFETGAGGEIQLTDAMAKLIGSQPFHGYRYEGQRYDCGSRLGFIEANIAYSLKDKEIGDDVRQILQKYGSSQS